MAGPALREKAREDMMTEQEFSGVLVAHWEAPRFCIQRGTKLMGLLPHFESWLAHFPDSFSLQSLGICPQQGEPSRYVHMRVRATLSAPGHFGHKGICRRELFVSQVLEAEELAEFEPLW
jgi:hypothetical protein